ncbi:MAG: hypothetical protein QM813_00355 [Verrucomicrobiota bacterium]
MDAPTPKSLVVQSVLHFVLVALVAPALVLAIHACGVGNSPFDILLPYMATPFVFGGVILILTLVSGVAFHFLRCITLLWLQHFVGVVVGGIGGLVIFRFVIDTELHDSTLRLPCISAGVIVGAIAPFIWRYEKRHAG